MAKEVCNADRPQAAGVALEGGSVHEIAVSMTCRRAKYRDFLLDPVAPSTASVLLEKSCNSPARPHRGRHRKHGLKTTNHHAGQDADNSKCYQETGKTFGLHRFDLPVRGI